MAGPPLVLAALALAAAAPLAAQRPQPRVFVNGEEVSPLDLIASRRARLGVLLDMRAVENDSIGATIALVTPGSPAAKAGLQGGDIIIRFNGRSLVDRRRDQDDDDDSIAALRLIDMVARIDPGDTVQVEFRRGSDTRTVTVETDRERSLALFDFGDGTFAFRVPMDRPVSQNLVSRLRRIGPDEGSGFSFSFGGPLADLQLAPMNEDLGAYFGTSEGVLVIDAPAENTFGLKGGDVILSVDGRTPRGPSSLLRILGSYMSGDVVRLEILRNKSRQTISSKIERDDE